MTRNTFTQNYAKPMLDPKLFKYHSSPLAFIANKLVTHSRECLHGIDSFMSALSWVASYAYEEGRTARTLFPQSYSEFVESEFIPSVWEMFDTKGAEYTEATRDDRLQNFKMVSEESERLNPLDVWYAYLMKHVFSLLLYTRNGVAKTEPIYARCVDVAAYLILGKALCDEVRGNNVLS
jgi:hypothetical protein